MAEHLRTWGAACETAAPMSIGPTARLSRAQRLDVARMGVAAIAASGFFLTLAIMRPALPARSYAGVALRAAVNDPPRLPWSDGASVVLATAPRGGMPQRVKQRAHPRPAVDPAVAAATSAPVTPPPGAERAGHALTRFLVGDGRYRVEPFPTVAAGR